MCKIIFGGGHGHGLSVCLGQAENFSLFSQLFIGPTTLLILFMGPCTIQLTFSFIYNTFSKKFSVSTK